MLSVDAFSLARVVYAKAVRPALLRIAAGQVLPAAYVGPMMLFRPPLQGGEPAAGAFDRLMTVLRTNTTMIVGFMVSAAVLVVVISIAKGGLAAQIFHLLGAPNAVSRSWMNVIESAILVAVPLLTGVIVSIIISLFAPDGAIQIDIPAINVTVQ